ncbi:MAG TPA: J domain-containing protein [Pirellulales bacterium]|nr:J domain-containing protein [Pirellulales bacterium]
MSDLPDDVRRWPSDPFKLLGVPKDVPPQDLKRAYTRLIRTYKPEHAPEEFRRIREAYDTVRQFVEMFSAMRQEASSLSFEEEAGAAIASAPARESPARDEPARPLARSLEEELQECWQWAIDGDGLKAYRELERLHAVAPHDARIGARLYWLLTLGPKLDGRRAPCDWLVAGLRRNGLSGPLRELYRRELAANPDEAMHPRCAELIDSLPVSPGLADLLEWRWQALARRQQAAELIRADLARLRQRMLAHDDEMWARLVFSAADHLAFVDTAAARDLLARCQHDLEGLSHLHLRLSAAFDRFEMLQTIATASRTLLQQGAIQHADFVEVAQQAWSLPAEEQRPKLMAYLATVAARPGQRLHNFDAVQQLASPLLFQFRRALAMLESITEPTADTRSEGDIQELVLSFARDTPGSKYSEWRPQLLDFCLREVIMPEQVAAALAGNVEFQLSAEQHLSQAAANDLPLVCVCHACRLFWA